jgi:hypothetical protein
MKELRILGVMVTNRTKDSTTVQHILTKFGCSIKTRLGLHEVTSDTCTNYGLILLELTGEKAEWDKLEAELLKVEGVLTKKISFEL